MTARRLYDWFGDSVGRHAAATAIEVSGFTLSYAELRAAVDRMAVRVVADSGRLPRRVGLLTSRSLASYVSYLAILRLGAAVVPLDPGAPVARNLMTTSDAGLDAAIVDDTSAKQLPAYPLRSGIPIVDLTGDRWRAALHGETGPLPATGAGDIAYIIYTSGSTGTPKGVPITNANISTLLAHNIAQFGFTADTRASQTFELFFDGSVCELFQTWGAGGTLCVPQPKDVFTPVRFVNENRLTHWLSVPSIISFARRLRALPPGSMPGLRRALFGGEALTVEQVAAWQAAAPNGRINNCYGPTETTCICTGYEVPADWPVTSNRSMPIGDIYPHMDHVLLDGEGRPCNDGELCLRGPQRFGGYLDPRQNAGRFLTFDGHVGTVYDGTGPLTPEHWYRTGDRIRRENGELVHLGRVDDQIKIRGNRVELGGIESVLRRHPAIAEVVVITLTAADGEVDLHAAYTGDSVDETDFARLAAELPVYMRPRGYHHRDSIPLAANGKIDRKGLAAELAPVVR
ncbi:AMP-binding protein [Actinocrispum wychmicini]|uniref:Amino acid adenylation domain-containing protein n=1 Tax=Actinocrispum wychmicini TaxID=1213861 RepID=A0A4R2JBG4_9PSEU|nr:AMP-binding protein [Actinocrispum wychmicini]TCO54086.1 amino acid adenylation domain-containing protein [Actinocrispum wychmicini]